MHDYYYFQWVVEVWFLHKGFWCACGLAAICSSVLQQLSSSRSFATTAFNLGTAAGGHLGRLGRSSSKGCLIMCRSRSAFSRAAFDPRLAALALSAL